MFQDWERLLADKMIDTIKNATNDLAKEWYLFNSVIIIGQYLKY
jgi:hypothetical protein